MIKIVTVILSSFLLGSCLSDNRMIYGEDIDKPVAIDFIVGGVLGVSQSNPSLDPTLRKTASDTSDSITRASMPLADNLEMEASLRTHYASTIRTSTTRGILLEDIRYRVIAYSLVDNSYVGYADYKISAGSSLLINGGLQLANGTYKFVAYSYQNSNPIIESAVDGNVNLTLDDDFLYWEGEVTVNGTATVPIYFKRMFSQLQIILDATDVESEFTEASVSLGSSIGSLYREGVWNVASSNINTLKTPYTSVFNFGVVSGSRVSSMNQWILPLSNQALTLTVNAKLANGSIITNKVLDLPLRNFHSNYSYTCTVKIKPSGISLVENQNDTNGYSYGGGNCWVVPTSDLETRYFFDATKEGQSIDPIGTTVITSKLTRDARVVWMDNPNLITQATWNNGNLTFGVGAGQTGNAVIAVTDDSGAIGRVLWSWHIWVVADNSFMNPLVSQRTFMDRNLGAMSNTQRSATSRGLLYQWGRKDPFRPISYTLAQGASTISYAVENPNKFVSDTTVPFIWCSEDLDLWGNSSYMQKYNPCPKGWTVMSSSDVSSFTVDNAGVWNWGYTWNGVYFPYAGGLYRGSYSSGSPSGIYWTRTRIDGTEAANVLYFSNSYVTTSITNYYFGAAYSVRCVRE